jgi:hypothetical protein
VLADDEATDAMEIDRRVLRSKRSVVRIHSGVPFKSTIYRYLTQK